MGSPLKVDTGELRRAADRVADAAAKVEQTRTTEVGLLGAGHGPGGWQTLPAMDSCAASADRQLSDLVAGLTDWAAAVRRAAREYDAADARAGHRFGPYLVE